MEEVYETNILHTINIVFDSVVVLICLYLAVSIFVHNNKGSYPGHLYIKRLVYFLSDLKRLLEGSHVIDKKNLTVTRQPLKKKVPLDPVKVHVQGLNETTSEDCMRYYLEQCTSVEVTEVYKGCNNNALVFFDTEPGKQH